MTINNSLFKLKDLIPTSSRFGMHEAVKFHEDKIEITVIFGHSTTSGGKSGSKNKMLPLDISEEEFNRELSQLKSETYEYFFAIK